MDLARRYVPSSDDTGTGEERGMNEVTDISEPRLTFCISPLIAISTSSGSAAREASRLAWAC